MAKRKPRSEKARRREHRLTQLAKREAFEAAKPKLRVDAAVQMFRGTALSGIEGNPITDPLFLPDEQFQERRRIMHEVDAFENHCCVVGPATNYITVRSADLHNCDYIDWHHSSPEGTTVRIADYIEWQNRTAYNLLKQGVTERAVAAIVHRPVDWVQAVATKFQIHQPIV